MVDLLFHLKLVKNEIFLGLFSYFMNRCQENFSQTLDIVLLLFELTVYILFLKTFLFSFFYPSLKLRVFFSKERFSYTSE